MSGQTETVKNYEIKPCRDLRNKYKDYETLDKELTDKADAVYDELKLDGGGADSFHKKVEEHKDENGKMTEYDGIVENVMKCFFSQDSDLVSSEAKEKALITGVSVGVPAAAVVGGGTVGGIPLVWPYLKKFLFSIFK